METKYLYEENGFLYFRNEKGQISKHPKSKFTNNQIVTTSDKRHSVKNIIRLKSPRYTKERGWVYIENYINIQGDGGGSSFWNNEDLYKKIDDARFLMIAKRIELRESIIKADSKLKAFVLDLNKIEFTMNLAVKDYKTATHSCKKCGSLFKNFDGGDPNKDLCLKCLK